MFDFVRYMSSLVHIRRDAQHECLQTYYVVAVKRVVDSTSEEYLVNRR